MRQSPPVSRPSIGMTLFPEDLAPYAPNERVRLLADFADAGLEHVHCGDHVSFHDGYGWDGFVNAATFLALGTTRCTCTSVSICCPSVIP